MSNNHSTFSALVDTNMEGGGLARHLFIRDRSNNIIIHLTRTMDLCTPATADAMELSNLSLADDNDDSSIMSIYDLPEYAIREIIDYIPKTSRALLALALTTDSSLWREVHWCKSSPKSILTWFKKKKKKTGSSGSSSSEEKCKRPSAITKIILSAKNAEEEKLWEEIDFTDISEEYADVWCQCPEGFSNCCCDVPRLESKLIDNLSDDDIAGMLACINAVHKLKSLNLGNCFPLIGSALEPLRGSTILERIDLSLLGSIPNFDPFHQCNLSQTVVIPVLNSIIDRQNHRLRHLQFPREWRRDVHSVESGYLADFLEKYNATEHQQSIHCKECGANCHECLSPVREDERFDGIQHFTCYDCLSHYCYRCKDEVENDFLLKFCDRCERWRCRDCEPMVACCCTQHLNGDLARRNGSYMCQRCSEENKCDMCSHVFCRGCEEDGDGLLRCNSCDNWGCDDCMQMMFCEHDGCEVELCLECRQDDDDENTLPFCDRCHKTLCFKHRYESCKEDWDNCCAECLRMVAPMLVLPGVMEPSLLQG